MGSGCEGIQVTAVILAPKVSMVLNFLIFVIHNYFELLSSSLGATREFLWQNL